MDFSEKTVKKNYVFSGRVISVRKDDALLPDGRPCTREVVEHPGGASVLYIRDGKALFVRQFRYAYGETLLEIPAGKLEKGEDPERAAIRELEEEAGICVESVKPFFVLYPTPGYDNEKIYIYYAEGGRNTFAHLDEDEFLAVEWIDVDTAFEMIQNGEIRDAKTIVAIERYLLERKK